MRLLATIFALALSACVAQPVQPPASNPAPSDPAFAAALVSEVNAVRARNRLPPLDVDPRLNEAALTQARDNAARGLLDHRGADGSIPGGRVFATGYVPRLVMENLAAGLAEPAAVVRAWMDSPGHRRALLSREVIAAGAALIAATRPDDAYGVYVALVLARPLEPTRVGPTR